VSEEKMFNPKITPGEWVHTPGWKGKPVPYVRLGEENVGFHVWGDNDEEDAKAIAAVPELLAVYKAATHLKGTEKKWEFNHENNVVIFEDGEEFLEMSLSLVKAIEKLEKMHCKE